MIFYLCISEPHLNMCDEKCENGVYTVANSSGPPGRLLNFLGCIITVKWKILFIGRNLQHLSILMSSFFHYQCGGLVGKTTSMENFILFLTQYTCFKASPFEIFNSSLRKGSRKMKFWVNGANIPLLLCIVVSFSRKDCTSNVPISPPAGDSRIEENFSRQETNDSFFFY